MAFHSSPYRHHSEWEKEKEKKIEKDATISFATRRKFHGLNLSLCCNLSSTLHLFLQVIIINKRTC
jgi:hypothetical protein